MKVDFVMGVPERRERERQELRAKIMDAARRLFARDGYESVSMRKIADAIEYSPTAIYLHFADKAALFAEICGEDFGRLAGVFGELATVADPVERVARIGRAYVRFALEYPNHYRLMFMTPTGDEVMPRPEHLARRGNPGEDAYAFLRAAVAEALAAGRWRAEFTDADLLTQALWSTVHGVASLQVTHCKDKWVEWRPVEAIVDTVCGSMLRGLLRDPSTFAMPAAAAKKSSAKAARAATTSTPKRHCPVAGGARRVAKALAEAIQRNRRDPRPSEGGAR